MKIICIGLNYKSHIQELKCETPEQPLFFLKPETSMILRNRPFFLPDFSNDIHYEVELLVKINKVGKFIQKRFAHTYYDEIGLGIASKVVNSNYRVYTEKDLEILQQILFYGEL